MKTHAILVAAASLTIIPAHGVIVGGVNGDGFNNAGESTLQSYLVSASAPAFPYWDNVVRYSDASAVYLGYNPSTMEGWVLSANHITETTTIGIGGHTYNIIDPLPGDPNQNGTLVVSGSVTTDLVLYKFSVGGGDPIPPMPTVPLSSVVPSNNETLVMIGRGSRLNAGTMSEDTTPPYSWAYPGTSDSVPFRWGSNVVHATGLTDVNGAKYIRTDFDASGFDGQASNGDSGGGLFILRGGQWVLAATLGGVSDGPDGDALVDPAGYGDFSDSTDLFVYRTKIGEITGTLIPEPSLSLLVLPALALFFRRRR